jgi:cystathionine beta-lyase/cystathionine gamma-synthase
MSTQSSTVRETSRPGEENTTWGLSTLAIHSGCTQPDTTLKPIVPAIYTATTFKQPVHTSTSGGTMFGSGVEKQPLETIGTRETSVATGGPYTCTTDWQFGKQKNPTRASLETCLASLEGAHHSIALSSGNAALTVLWSLLKTGDHFLVIDDVYVDTKRFLQDYSSRVGVTSSFVDMSNLGETMRHCTPKTRVWAAYDLF